jgi:hypothetical protein
MNQIFIVTVAPKYLNLSTFQRINSVSVRYDIALPSGDENNYKFTDEE